MTSLQVLLRIDGTILSLAIRSRQDRRLHPGDTWRRRRAPMDPLDIQGRHGFCNWSINAWPVIIGPSPGNSFNPDPTQQGVYLRKRGHLVLGIPHPFFATYCDTAGYHEHLWGPCDRKQENRRHICSQPGIVPAFFERLGASSWQSAVGLSFHTNLTTQRQGSERNITREDLDEGVPRAMSIIEETKCKCVLTVSARVFRRINRSLAETYLFVDGGSFSYHCTQDYSPPWELWKSKDGGRLLMLAKTPQHPGKSNFWHEGMPEFAADLGNVAHEKLLGTDPQK